MNLALARGLLKQLAAPVKVATREAALLDSEVCLMAHKALAALDEPATIDTHPGMRYVRVPPISPIPGDMHVGNLARRTLWRADLKAIYAPEHPPTDGNKGQEVYLSADREPASSFESANLISSRLEGDAEWHAPAIDLDVPASLVESSTPGHFHLYIDHAIRWEDYLELLAVLKKCGLIEDGYDEASRARRMTHLRIRPDKFTNPTGKEIS